MIYDDSKRNEENVAASSASKPNNAPDGKITASAGVSLRESSIEENHSNEDVSAATADEASSPATKTCEKMKATEGSVMDVVELVSLLSDRGGIVKFEDAQAFMRKVFTSAESRGGTTTTTTTTTSAPITMYDKGNDNIEQGQSEIGTFPEEGVHASLTRNVAVKNSNRVAASSGESKSHLERNESHHKARTPLLDLFRSRIGQKKKAGDNAAATTTLTTIDSHDISGKDDDDSNKLEGLPLHVANDRAAHDLDKNTAMESEQEGNSSIDYTMPAADLNDLEIDHDSTTEQLSVENITSSNSITSHVKETTISPDDESEHEILPDEQRIIQAPIRVVERLDVTSLDRFEQRRRLKMKQNNFTHSSAPSNVEVVVHNETGGSAVREEDQGRTSSSNLVGENDEEVVGAAQTRDEWTKERTSSNARNKSFGEVGVTEVHEQAPQINRRFYLGLDRPSVILRNARARHERRRRRRRGGQTPATTVTDNGGEGEERIRQSSTAAGLADGGDGSNQRDSSIERMSTLVAHVSATGEHLISATLVEDVDEEVVFAEPVGFLAQKYKLFVFATIFLLIFIATIILVTKVMIGDDDQAGPQEVSAQKDIDVICDEWCCDPCINRTKYTIKILLNGYDSSGIQRLGPIVRQSAKDMGVNLDVDYYIEESSDKQMAVDIRAAALSKPRVDALIVDIPSKAVALAVRFAAENDMPVYGMNSGFEFASGPEGLVEDGSMMFFTAMDDRLGGEMAASYFLQQSFGANVDETGTSSIRRTSVSKNYARALFVAPNTSTYEHRYQGYRDRLMEASNSTIDVEWIADKTHLDKLLAKKLSGCMYQSVLIGKVRLIPRVVRAIEESGCNQVKLGSFGIDPNIGLAMDKGLMDFVIDQQHHLHGWTAVQFATLYITTGLIIAPPQGGVYLSGPALMTKDNFTRGILSICKDSNKTIGLTPDHECIHRNTISIGGVVHGTTTDKFWDAVFSAANQSAIDMGIDLKFDRFEPQESNQTLYKRMSSTILNLCDTGIDGLFVTIPDDVIVEAVSKCQELNPNVQILSINAGYEKSKELNLIHHVGMLEKDAGYQAGKKMAKFATFNKALCWNHIPGLNVLDDRCKGFEQAMNELGIKYLGQILVQESDINGSVSAIERAVNQTGDWGGYGILLTALISLPAALELRKSHSSFVMGSFDTNSLLYDSLETGDVLFGMDQQPYLQGYLPISILTHVVTSKQSLLDHSIKSGPRFVIAPPTDERSACEDRHFPVCPVEGNSITFSSLSPTWTAQPSSSMQPSVFPTVKPLFSMQPSSVPSFDQRPTLEIVQIRGHVRCGLLNATVKSQEGFQVDLCRAVAGVLFGDPERFVGVPVTSSTRFEQLNERAIDLLLYGDTHTIEREIKERTTGAGFTFSSPYFYDGMAYFGVQSFVRCAEENERFDACSDLRICATAGSTGLDFVQSSFPSDFVKVGLTIEENKEMLFNNTCNVFAYDQSILLNIIPPSDDRDFIVGDILKTKEPLAIVTHKHDREFSDTINWVLHAIFYGEEQGLTKNSSLCEKYTTLTSYVSDLNFMNAVYCVGNYEEVFVGDNSNRGMNQINNGTGMLYATPFGELESGDDTRDIDGIAASSFLDDIREKRSLNCGVVVPDRFVGELRESNKLVGMSVDYCRTIAAAIFYGDTNLIKLSSFSEKDNNSFYALQNTTIDVLFGRRVEKKYDFVNFMSLGGFHFSSPYYIGNGTSSDDVRFFSVTTREDDATFSSFVNCVVLATLYAEEKGIMKKSSKQMPLSPIFGSELNWALRDAIAYSGSYDKIYAKNFGDVAKEQRGRNILNEYGAPQIHSFPGLSP